MFVGGCDMWELLHMYKKILFQELRGKRHLENIKVHLGGSSSSGPGAYAPYGVWCVCVCVVCDCVWCVWCVIVCGVCVCVCGV